jgi:hypothetical protein
MYARRVREKARTGIPREAVTVHTFDSVLRLFVAELGHPSTISRDDEDNGNGPVGRNVAYWFLDPSDPWHCNISLEDDGDEVTVFACSGKRGGFEGWELNQTESPTGCELVTPEEALRLAMGWARVPS